MKYLMCAAAALATATAFAGLPAEAANYARQGHHRAVIVRPAPIIAIPFDDAYVGSGGRGDGPNWQGSLTDNLPIWRHGYYQGDDPDQFIRGQLMRDPRNGASGK